MTPAQSTRGATFNFWQESNGYWSASVVIRIPQEVDWTMQATLFHDAAEALEWCRQQMFLAVDSA